MRLPGNSLPTVRRARGPSPPPSTSVLLLPTPVAPLLKFTRNHKSSFDSPAHTADCFQSPAWGGASTHAPVYPPPVNMAIGIQGRHSSLFSNLPCPVSRANPSSV